MTDPTDPTPVEPPEADPTPEAPPACEGCGEPLDAGNALTLCPDCTGTCEDCGEQTAADDLRAAYTARAHRGAERLVCESCAHEHYFECRVCDGLCHNEDAVDIEHMGPICRPCFLAGDYSVCEDCGYTYRYRDTIYREHRDASYCEDCDPGDEEDEDEREDAGPYVIASYHSTRARRDKVPSPWTRAHRARFLGVELEVEAPTDANREEIARTLDAVNGESVRLTADHHQSARLVTFEYDGSLSHGFEIITAPMGLDDQRAVWTDLLARTAGHRLRSHQTTTCGLHVHVSRAGLTPTHVARAVSFVNDERNAELVACIARRGPNQYCKMAPKKISRETARDNGDRYQAVNLCHPGTLEFRMFRGTLKRSSLLACIEFAAAVVAYCAPCASGFQPTASGFLDFIAAAAMRADTPHLRAYFAERLRGQPLPANFHKAAPGPIPAATLSED